jgi:hypothetical protein
MTTGVAGPGDDRTTSGAGRARPRGVGPPHPALTSAPTRTSKTLARSISRRILIVGGDLLQ